MSESTPSSNKTLLWVGRVLSALPVLALVMSGLMKVTSQPPVVEQLGKAGYTAGAITAIGVVELLSAALYAAPPTSVLGAILVTGYLGGAINTHVRVSEGFAPALILGILAWAGLFLRDARLRELLPLRKAALAWSPFGVGLYSPGAGLPLLLRVLVRGVFRWFYSLGVGAAPRALGAGQRCLSLVLLAWGSRRPSRSGRWSALFVGDFTSEGLAPPLALRALVSAVCR